MEGFLDREELGITLELSPEAVEELQRGEARRRQRQQRTNNDTNEDEDPWNDVIPMMPTAADHHSEGAAVTEESSEQHDDDDVNNEDDDDLSFSPPSSLPLVLVDLERLVGYLPATPEEAEKLRQTVHAALSSGPEHETTPPEQRPNPQGCGTEEEESHEGLAADFDARLQEMFDNGTARHTDTSQSVSQNQSLRYVTVNYPEYLCRRTAAAAPDGGEEEEEEGGGEEAEVVNTARVWKRLLRRHGVPVVDRLLGLGRDSGRSLFWKRDMGAGLRRLAALEEEARVRRAREAELRRWRTVRRGEELEKLYAVRETFRHRAAVAEEKLRALERRRDAAVREELNRRRMLAAASADVAAAAATSSSSATAAAAGTTSLLGAMEAFDFDNPVSDYATGLTAEDLFGGLRTEEENDAYQHLPIMSSDDDDNEIEEVDHQSEVLSEEADDGDNEVAGGQQVVVAGEGEAASMQLPCFSKERRQAAARRRRHKLQIAAEEAERKARKEAAAKEEERVREAYTTQDLRMAQAVVKSLQERLQQVEDLLESLQEEEWADEEEKEDVEEEGPSSKLPASSSQTEPSLLDQILAMIFVATPASDGISQEEHFRRLGEEHLTILRQWKEHFGRLPPLLLPPQQTPSANKASQNAVVETKPPVTRESLGIVNNEDDDWEDYGISSDEEDVQTSEEARVQEVEPAKKVVTGLRPGGRAVR